MKNLIKKFTLLDNLDKGGIIFVVTFIVPSVILVLRNVVQNGSRMM